MQKLRSVKIKAPQKTEKKRTPITFKYPKVSPTVSNLTNTREKKKNNPAVGIPSSLLQGPKCHKEELRLTCGEGIRCP